MAKILSMPAGAGAELSIYDEGSQGVALGSTGFAYGSDTIIDGTFNPAYFNVHGAASSSAVVGTLAAVDVSGFNTLHIIMKNKAAWRVSYGANASKTIPTAVDTTNKQINTIQSDYTELTVDVSGLTSAYVYVAATQTNTDCDVKKIWLT